MGRTARGRRVSVHGLAFRQRRDGCRWCGFGRLRPHPAPAARWASARRHARGLGHGSRRAVASQRLSLRRGCSCSGALSERSKANGLAPAAAACRTQQRGERSRGDGGDKGYHCACCTAAVAVAVQTRGGNPPSPGKGMSTALETQAVDDAVNDMLNELEDLGVDVRSPAVQWRVLAALTLRLHSTPPRRRRPVDVKPWTSSASRLLALRGRGCSRPGSSRRGLVGPAAPAAARLTAVRVLYLRRLLLVNVYLYSLRWGQPRRRGALRQPRCWPRPRSSCLYTACRRSTGPPRR